MDTDTRIGGADGRFPETRHSAIAAARSGNEADRALAHESIVAAYWKPVYKYIRIKWKSSNEDAKDLTQSFFLRALEKDFFDAYSPDKGSFRTYLRVCLDGFLANEKKSSDRLKRGGGTILLPLDFTTAEGELKQIDIAHDDSPDRFFAREWTRSLFELALSSLRDQCAARGKQLHYELFARYDLAEEGARATYAQLAGEFNLSTVTVTNYLAAVRRDFRGIVLEKLRGITATEQEFRNEARALLGAEM
jgi:RNA polymerase sigma factor (sigma-70 family)